MKFIKVIKAEEQIHKVPFEAENAAECAKQLVKNFELYNHFSSEVSLGDMIETKDGNRFVVQDVMDFVDKYEKEMKKESAVMQPNKPKPTTMLPDNMTWSWDPNAQDWVAVLKDNTNVTPPLYDPNNQNITNQTTSYMSTVKSSCLSKFLDGPQYSKEIKIEAGLIKEGLVKYAGFDFNKGTKYAITDKGLEVLRKVSEAEHNEALNEREKLAYLFGFNTDEVSTLDTTGKTIKSDKKLNTKSLVNKLYNEIKKNKNNWEDVDDLSQYTHIDTKEEDNGIMVYVRTELSYDEMMKLAEILNKVVQKFDSLSYFEPLQPGIMQAYIENKKSASLNKFAKKWTIYEADGSELGKVEADSELDAKVKFGIEHPEYADSQSICAKEINAQYEQTTETHEPYPNPSETPHDDIVLENHDGWVNTADNHFEYTEEQKRLLPLFKLVNQYVLRKEAIISEDVQNDDGFVVSGTAEIINDLEHKIKDLGFYCEPVAEIVDNSYIGKDIYSLRVFEK